MDVVRNLTSREVAAVADKGFNRSLFYKLNIKL